MIAVLISIRPKWCEKIISGEKTIEVRKTRPKMDTPFKCYIYCMPSCRMCNHYKRANSLETFRRYIAEIPRKLRENYIYKVGVVYGNVIEQEKPITFYFEMEDKA